MRLSTVAAQGVLYTWTQWSSVLLTCAHKHGSSVWVSAGMQQQLSRAGTAQVAWRVCSARALLLCWPAAALLSCAPHSPAQPKELRTCEMT
jgi:hypothetical protein